MRMRPLHLGSEGDDVGLLQQKLNAVLSPSPHLPITRQYDSRTEFAVRRFQDRNWLFVDGMAGMATLCALHGREEFNILHNVRFINQPSVPTCWAAATAMMTGLSFNDVIARTPRDLLNPSGALDNVTDTQGGAERGARFARVFGLTCRPPQSFPVPLLVNMLQTGPLMMNMLHRSNQYAHGGTSTGHMIVVVGIRGSIRDNACTIRIYDPWPPNQGEIRSTGYARWIQDCAARTYQVYSRA